MAGGATTLCACWSCHLTAAQLVVGRRDADVESDECVRKKMRGCCRGGHGESRERGGGGEEKESRKKVDGLCLCAFEVFSPAVLCLR